jgi:hypothetical protein
VWGAFHDVERSTFNVDAGLILPYTTMLYSTDLDPENRVKLCTYPKRGKCDLAQFPARIFTQHSYIFMQPTYFKAHSKTPIFEEF